jgi:CheY-like chemotaxis protein
MDHMMPEMDGLETTHIIRSINVHNSKVPIIALTANVIKGTEQIFLSNSMDDILPKPIDLILLNSCLRKWLPKLIIEETVK